MRYGKFFGCAVIAVGGVLWLAAADCHAQEPTPNSAPDSQIHQQMPQGEPERPDGKDQESRWEGSGRPAEESRRDHSCTVGAAGIFATPEGQDRGNFNHGGWGFQAGGGFAVTSPIGPGHGSAWYLDANYLYDKFRARGSALAYAISQDPQLTGAKSAHGNFSAITLDPTFRFAGTRHFNAYATGGFGWLRRGVDFNSKNPVPGLLLSGSSLARAATNSGVLDAAVGNNFSPEVLHGAMLFIEVRVYHGLAINSLSTLVPVSLGVRW
jgi:hypothetical protein